jgi:hypothetical protein
VQLSFTSVYSIQYGWKYYDRNLKACYSQIARFFLGNVKIFVHQNNFTVCNTVSCPKEMKKHFQLFMICDLCVLGNGSLYFRLWIRVARWHIFKPKIWINFVGSCNGSCWYIIYPFDLFCGYFGICRLVYFMVIWHTFPVLVCCPKKNLATLPWIETWRRQIQLPNLSTHQPDPKILLWL